MQADKKTNWEFILRLYSEAALKVPIMMPMQVLVEKLKDSRYAEGLFVWTSVWKLCIAQLPVENYPARIERPHLIINPMPNAQLDFEYMDSRDRDRRWHRVVDADKGFARLESFFDQLHWFVTEKKN